MSRKRLLTLSAVIFLLLSGMFAVVLWSPALSAASACRRVMERAEGYGPWRSQAIRPLDGVPGNQVVASYFDGYNTATCHAQQLGPVWIVRGVGQTLVACGLGLGADRAHGCPRGTYGVIP